jgi:hypothetical protein
VRAFSSLILLGAGICTLGFAAPAAAEDLRGFYAGASIGRADLRLEDADSTYDFHGNDVGYQFTAGYRIIKWVAVEANYSDYGRPDDDVVGVDFASKFTSYSLSAVGLWPVRDFDFYARAGVAHWDGELKAVRSGLRSSQNSNDPQIGIGAQYRLGNLGLRLDAQNILLGFDDDGDDRTDGDDWLSIYSFGFTYQFR